MASLLFRRSLLLPPAVRTSIYQSSLRQSTIIQSSQFQSRRNASSLTTYEVPTSASDAATAVSSNSLAEWAMTLPSYFLDALHATGLPWWAVIPMAAVIVRSAIIYPVSSLPTRRKQILRRGIQPIIATRMRRILINRKAQRLPPSTALIGFQQMLRMYSHFKLPLFDGRGLWNLGWLIVFTETIRVKCGAREGMLSAVTKGIEWIWGSITGKKSAPTPASEAVQAPPISPEEALAQRLYEAREAQSQAAASSSTSSPPTDLPVTPETMSETIRLAKLNTNPYAEFVDPTMHTEGIAFLSDLTLPDPTFLLPSLLSLTMAAGILLRSSSAVSTTPLTPSAVPTKKPALGFGQRLGLSFSLIFGIAATQFPAAVLLYLVPSMTMGWLQTRWLDVKYPIPGVVEPCKKPVRFKVRKEFDMPA